MAYNSSFIDIIYYLFLQQILISYAALFTLIINDEL